MINEMNLADEVIGSINREERLAREATNIYVAFTNANNKKHQHVCVLHDLTRAREFAGIHRPFGADTLTGLFRLDEDNQEWIPVPPYDWSDLGDGEVAR